MYTINKNRYYELKYFCMQYGKWQEEYFQLWKDNPELYRGKNPTAEIGTRLIFLSDRITLIEKIARECFRENFNTAIYCLSNGYKLDCMEYRKFFWMLDQERG